MRFFLTPLIALLITAVSFSAEAQQNEPERVQAVIEQLFDGMRESDSSKVATAFTKEAVMQTIGSNQEGEIVINNGNLERFLRAAGTPKDEIWDERISSYNINIDGELASVWTPYQFYRGEEFSHCGVNSFQLVKTGDGWKIFHIVDTRRQDNCIN